MADAINRLAKSIKNVLLWYGIKRVNSFLDYYCDQIQNRESQTKKGVTP